MSELEMQHNGDEFALGSLPIDLLEGIMQRARGKVRDQIELVDQRFAVVAHRLAWRHCHTLKVDLRSPYAAWCRIAVGSYNAEVADTAAATRFLVARSTIHNVEFDVSIDRVADHELRQAQCRHVLVALGASERVTLRSLVLHQTPAHLFDGSEQVAALIRRHSATLQDVGLFFGDNEPGVAVGNALSACPSLHKLTAFVEDWFESDGFDWWQWQQSLSQLIQRLQLSSLTMSGQGCRKSTLSLAKVLSSAPMLAELRITRFRAAFDADKDWSALANLRLLQTNAQCVHLAPDCTQAEANRVFATVLPSLQALILSHESSPHVYWGVLKKLVGAFLNRAGDHSLAVQLGVFECDGQAWRRPLTEWRAVFPQLSVEGFGPKTLGQMVQGEAASARPKLPEEFQHVASSQVVVLGRPNEARRITVALWRRLY